SPASRRGVPRSTRRALPRLPDGSMALISPPQSATRPPMRPYPRTYAAMAANSRARAMRPPTLVAKSEWAAAAAARRMGAGGAAASVLPAGAGAAGATSAGEAGVVIEMDAPESKLDDSDGDGDDGDDGDDEDDEPYEGVAPDDVSYELAPASAAAAELVELVSGAGSAGADELAFSSTPGRVCSELLSGVWVAARSVVPAGRM